MALRRSQDLTDFSANVILSELISGSFTNLVNSSYPSQQTRLTFHANGVEDATGHRLHRSIEYAYGRLFLITAPKYLGPTCRTYDKGNRPMTLLG